MLALAAVQTAILDVPELCRIATREHLRHQTVVIGGLIARMSVLKRLPVIGKDLLKDTPVPGGCCQHPRLPSEGGWNCDGAVVVPRLLRAVHSSSPMAITAYRSNTKNANSYTIEIGQEVESPGKPPDIANGPCQRRRSLTPQERAHEFRGVYGSG